MWSSSWSSLETCLLSTLYSEKARALDHRRNSPPTAVRSLDRRQHSRRAAVSHFRVLFPLSVRHIGNHGALKGECQNLETPTKREDTQIVDEKSKIHAPKILRILILPPNEPPKKCKLAVSIRTPRGRNQAGPLIFPIRKVSF